MLEIFGIVIYQKFSMYLKTARCDANDQEQSHTLLAGGFQCVSVRVYRVRNLLPGIGLCDCEGWLARKIQNMYGKPTIKTEWEFLGKSCSLWQHSFSGTH